MPHRDARTCKRVPVASNAGYLPARVAAAWFETPSTWSTTSPHDAIERLLQIEHG
jgi:hypothetical protein